MSDELSPSADFSPTCAASLPIHAARPTPSSIPPGSPHTGRSARRIVEEEQGGAAKASYGDRILPELSRTLTAEFGKDFSYTNLPNFRQFYLVKDDAIKTKGYFI